MYPGRIHMYQGYDALEVTSLVRHAHKLGCRSIMLSCASGAVRDVEPGTVGLITDQVNLTGRNPLESAEGAAAAAATEASACANCAEKCDSTAACCAEKADSTKACCEKSCCEKAEANK